MQPLRVVYTAADPFSYDPTGQYTLEPRLGLDEEIRVIQDRLDASHVGGAIDFYHLPAARADDLLRALRDFKPQVVHFSGHAGRDGIVLVGTHGEPHRLAPQALARLLQSAGTGVRLVLLNACDTDQIAQALASDINVTMGMAGPWPDASAARFSQAIYPAIALGYSLQTAFDQAGSVCVDDTVPRLFSKPGINPAEEILVARQMFANIRYTARKLHWWNYAASQDGTLLIDPDHLRFYRRDTISLSVPISSMLGVEKVRNAGDLRASWVRVFYGDPTMPSVAYLAQITRMGFDFLVGGSDSLYEFLRKLIDFYRRR